MTTELGIGFTHIALPVSDLDRSVAFYETWAGLRLVDRLEDPKTGNKAARLSDGTRPFMLALIETGEPVDVRLAGYAHLGVACRSRDEVDQLAGRAEEAGCLRHGPRDSGYPLGYWTFLIDPDGHQLELSYGQNEAPPAQPAATAGDSAPARNRREGPLPSAGAAHTAG
jgi:catechol 2,3-dioxygenase-like lactoylglutathione lyase family enzyme